MPEQLKRFREGDLSLIGVEKLLPPSGWAYKRELADYKIALNRFYLTLRETTQHLQDSCRFTIKRIKATDRGDTTKTY